MRTMWSEIADRSLESPQSINVNAHRIQSRNSRTKSALTKYQKNNHLIRIYKLVLEMFVDSSRPNESFSTKKDDNVVVYIPLKV